MIELYKLPGPALSRLRLPPAVQGSGDDYHNFGVLSSVESIIPLF